MNHPRKITERVEKFNEERRDRGEVGELSIETYDVQDFFTNINRDIFLEDLIKARERIRDRHPGINYF